MDVTPETRAWHATTCDGLGAPISPFVYGPIFWPACINDGGEITCQSQVYQGEIKRLRAALRFIVDRGNLMFAECADAEAIIARAKEALGS